MPQQLLPYWNALKRWWWLIAICAGVAGFTAYYFASRQAPVYYSSITLRVGAGTERPDLNTLQFGGTLAEFYEKFVRLPPITRGVVDKLGLSISPDQLASQIQTRVIPLAQLLEVTVFASSPEVAAELANAVGRELIEQTTPASDRALDPDYLQSELSTTRTQIDEIEARLRELREQMLAMTSAADLAEAQNRLDSLEQTKQELRTYYLQTAQLLTSRSTGALTVIVPATPNPFPVGTNAPRDAILGAVGGVLLAAGAIVLLEFSDTALRWGDVTLESQLPVLGIVPSISRRRSPLIISSKPNSAEADAVRSLRTRIFLVDAGAMIKRLLITSPTPRDGKSFTTVNLAIAAADAGLRVVIVDGDIRAGTIHEYFGLEREPGLTNLLWNPVLGAQLAPTLLRRTSVNHLQVLPAGTHARDPLTLLRSPRLKQLLEDLSERSDLIIIDSPPVAAGPYATLLAAVVDGIVMVAGIDRTNRKLFEKSRDELIKNAEAPLLGLALNRVALSKISPELGAYGYGYAYGATRAPKGRLARLRSLPGALFARVTRRPALSRNGQTFAEAAQWLEETPGVAAGDEQPPTDSPFTPLRASAQDTPVELPEDTSSSTAVAALKGSFDIMTVTEAAVQLEVPEQVIEEWCRTGKLPSVRIGKRWLVTGLSAAPDMTPDESSPEPINDLFDDPGDAARA